MGLSNILDGVIDTLDGVNKILIVGVIVAVVVVGIVTIINKVITF